MLGVVLRLPSHQYDACQQLEGGFRTLPSVRPHCHPHLQPDRAGGVLTEQRPLPDVATKHRRALVTSLLGDDTLGDAGRSSRGRKTGPQRVTGHLGGIKTDSGSVTLQYERHRMTAETRRADVAMTVHRAKGGSLCDA